MGTRVLHIALHIMRDESHRFCTTLFSLFRLSALLLVPALKLGHGHIMLDRTVIQTVFQHVPVRLADHRTGLDAQQPHGRRR